jgi:hypothetical protein
MVNQINQANFGGRKMVTCYTCHRATDRPEAIPSLLDQYSIPEDDPKIFTKPFVLSRNEYRWVPDQEAEEQMCVPSEMINYRKLISDPAFGVGSAAPKK